MKIHPFSVILVLAALCPVFAAQAAPSTWALLVGCGKFQNTFISPLKYPGADAQAIRDALVDPGTGAVPADHIKLLVDDQATAANINDAVDNFLKPNVAAGDHVVIFLASHGVAKGTGLDARSYFLPTDVKGLTKPSLEASGIDLQDFSRRLGALPASQFVLFVDACREDPTPGRGVKPNSLTDVLTRDLAVMPTQTNQKALAVTFFACKIGQRAYEDPDHQHGVFTYWILEGLKNGPVPQPPDGSVDMRRLATYVKAKVEDWSKQASDANGIEIDQTPQMEATNDADPVILVRVKRMLNGDPVPPATPDITVSVAARGVTAPAAGSAGDLFQRAVDAELREDWGAAAIGYGETLKLDPTNMEASERLASIRLRQGRNQDAIVALLNLYANHPTDAHALSLLSRAYSVYADMGPGDESGAGDRPAAVAGFGLPKDQGAARGLAHRSADAALKLQMDSEDAQLAEGFALVADDNKGRNKGAAIDAFDKAIFENPQDPVAHFGKGYTIRHFSATIKDADTRKEQLAGAIDELKKALNLRPNYYEAHRELAYCYHLSDETKSAREEYQMADANRGGASDKREVAGEDVAISALLRQEAAGSNGPQQALLMAASDGYLSDAKDITPNLKDALGVLSAVGLNTELRDYLPPDLRNIWDVFHGGGLGGVLHGIHFP